MKKFEKDNLKNRRRLAYWSAVGAMVWPIILLVCVLKWKLQTADLSLFLAYAGSVQGGLIGGYIWACNKEDKALLDVLKQKEMSLEDDQDPALPVGE